MRFGRPINAIAAAVQFGVAADALWWLAVLALPGDSFALAPGLRAMGDILAEEHWAALFGVAGGLCLAGPWLPWRRLSLAGLVAAGFLEGVVALCLASSALSGRSPGLNVGSHLVLAALSYALIAHEAFRGRPGT